MTHPFRFLPPSPPNDNRIWWSGFAAGVLVSVAVAGALVGAAFAAVLPTVWHYVRSPNVP